MKRNSVATDYHMFELVYAVQSLQPQRHADNTMLFAFAVELCGVSFFSASGSQPTSSHSVTLNTSDLHGTGGPHTGRPHTKQKFSNNAVVGLNASDESVCLTKC
jgi:hypothetical protein